MGANIVWGRNLGSGSKLFIFGNRGFRTRFWQKAGASALVVPVRFGKARRRRRVPQPSSWGGEVVVKERIEPLAKNKR